MDKLKKLEEIVNTLEKGESSLEESLKIFEDGMKISKDCNKLLQDAEKKITIILENNGEVNEDDFSTEDGWKIITILTVLQFNYFSTYIYFLMEDL